VPLTDIRVRNAKPEPRKKTTRLYDQRGLYLEVSPNGGKWWRLKYRFVGKERRISLGVYPETSLKEAREDCAEARELLKKGVDPSQRRKLEKLAQAEEIASSFESITREWFRQTSGLWDEGHSVRVMRRFERDIFPWIGARPIREITPPELLMVMRKIESRGAIDTAHRMLGSCGKVFRYAISTGRLTTDPARDLRDALPPVEGGNFAAVTEPESLAGILRAMDGYQGTVTVQCGLRLVPLVFVRPGELRKAEWKDVDLEKAEWRYTVRKTRTPHIVPLSRQAVEILRELHPLTGGGCYVFPGARTSKRPMSDNTILAALRRMGISAEETSGHGFRATARTILDEVLGVRPDLIEHQLAHAVRDPNGRAYNRTSFLAERRKMMQQWADYLDRLKAGGEAIPISQDS
jgi:integrase